MKGYVVVIDSEITDAEGLAGIASQLGEALVANGGRFLIRGGEISAYGGDLAPARVMVAEFDSVEQAKALMELQSFVELREQRSQFAKANAFVVEGV